MTISWDCLGNARIIRQYEDMAYPMLHTTCGKVHDAGNVEVLEHYSDCSRWKCPHCGGWCDDRVIGWGGNVERVER